MSIDLSNYSLAQWFHEREQNSCGYCKNPSGSISYGMYTERLTVEDYKDMIDRGWRRSGKYCYKPSMDKTCCPQYTIRCRATDFHLRKSQKKIIKKFNKFLTDGQISLNDTADPPYLEETLNDTTQHFNNDKLTASIDLTKVTSSESNTTINQPPTVTDSHTIESNTVPGLSSPTPKSLKKASSSRIGPDPNKPLCKKAKLLRLEKKKQKGKEVKTPLKNVQKTLSELLDEVPPTAKHKFHLKLIPTSECGPEWEEAKDIEFKLYFKYQTIVHNDKRRHLTMDVFMRFLVSSPLKPKPFPDGVDGPGYGSFHQQYWLDDTLIAVGVIDILPECISSVYFFYDPDYRNLTLGTYGSLKEVQFVQDLQKKIPDLAYYYMGFYIHSCPKMRYKGNLSPSVLLCPETYVWVPIEKCRSKLDLVKYSRLNDDIDAIDSNVCNDINNIKIVYKNKLMRAENYVKLFKRDKEIFINLGNLLGNRLAHRIIFWLD